MRGRETEREQPHNTKAEAPVISGHLHSYRALQLPGACLPPTLDHILLETGVIATSHAQHLAHGRC